MTVERADFDDLVTLVSQAPPWEKDRAAGRPDPAAGDRRGQGERARPDPPALDVEARQDDAEGAGPPRAAPSSRRRSGCSARSPTRAATGTRRTCRSSIQVAKALPLDVGAALLASSEGYTPRANNALDRAREEIGEIKEIANALADNLPAPKAPVAQVAAAQAEEEARRGPGAAAPRKAQPRRTAARPPRAATERRGRKRRRRRRKPSGGSAEGRPPADRTARRRVTKNGRCSCLLAIGFVAGVVTALSPCVLPVLPIVLAGGATGRRPLAIVAGIVVSFTVFTLFAAWLLDLLGLPEDVLRNLAIGAALRSSRSTLLVPQVARVARAAAPGPDPAERRRPRRRLPARRQPRARLRPVRRPGARRGDRDRGAARRRARQLPADAGLRARRRRADARDRVRRPARRARVPRRTPCSSAASRACSSPARRSRSRSASTRTCRPPCPATRRRCRSASSAPARPQRELRKLTGGRDPQATGARHGEAPGLRPGARLPRDRGAGSTRSR